MKIATLTFQNADSYGAMLQAYALQTAIRNMGYETEILGYICPAIEADYGFPRTLRGAVGRALRTPFFQIRRKRFKSFRCQFLSIGSDVERKDISSAGAQYDVFVVGSDQVWNPEITGSDSTYFLDFCSKKQLKVAYAASMGVNAWSHDAESENLRMLSDFDYLSVREFTAQEYLAAQGVRAEVVCDPTLLITPESYRALLQKDVVHGKYTLLACLQNPYKESVEFAREVAYERGERLVVLHSGWHDVSGVENIRSAGPCEFLTAISGASCVITESFHGCCLSILFGRDFYYFDPRINGQVKARSNRITDLLNDLGLAERDARDSVFPRDSIDYQVVNERLSQVRRKSAAFLKESLDMDKQGN